MLTKYHSTRIKTDILNERKRKKLTYVYTTNLTKGFRYRSLSKLETSLYNNKTRSLPLTVHKSKHKMDKNLILKHREIKSLQDIRGGNYFFFPLR